ncbi:MAG: hypothetical protein ACLSAP_02260 [Oscillospiraceae bacterium]
MRAPRIRRWCGRARAVKHGSRSANGCASRPVAQQALEQAFMASLAQALTESDRKAALALALAAVCKATGSGEANSRDQLENEIARTKQAGVRLSDLYLQDLLTKEQLAERAERLQARQEQLAARLKAFGAWEWCDGRRRPAWRKPACAGTGARTAAV